MATSFAWTINVIYNNSVSRDVSENELQPVLISDLQLQEITRELFPHVLNKNAIISLSQHIKVLLFGIQ